MRLHVQQLFADLRFQDKFINAPPGTEHFTKTSVCNRALPVRPVH